MENALVMLALVFLVWEHFGTKDRGKKRRHDDVPILTLGFMLFPKPRVTDVHKTYEDVRVW